MVTITLVTCWENIRDIKRLIRRLDKYHVCYIDLVPNLTTIVRGLGNLIKYGIMAKADKIYCFHESAWHSSMV